MTKNEKRAKDRSLYVAAVIGKGIAHDAVIKYMPLGLIHERGRERFYWDIDGLRKMPLGKLIDIYNE